MKLKNILLPLAASGSLIIPTWADPASNLIQNTVAEAADAKEIDIAAMSKKLGFTAHVPKNAEGYFNMMDTWDMYQRLLKTDLGKLIVEILNDQGADLEAMEQDDDFQMVKAILGEELFIVVGDDAGRQGSHLMEFSKSSNRATGKMLVGVAAAALEGRDPSEQLGALENGPFGSFLGDPDAVVEVFSKSELPPLMVGFKVSDDARRKQLADTIAGGLDQLLSDEDAPLDALNEERNGVKLTGFSVIGKKLAASADEDDREQMVEMLGSRENVDKVFSEMEKKNIHVATGVKDDYIIVYAGADLDGFQLADKPENSLLANEGMDFLADYAEKDVRMVMFAEEESLDTLLEGNEYFASLAEGLRDGLADTEAFGDTRDIQTLLGHAAKLDGELMGMTDYDRSGGVAFLEDGFKIESYGGSNLPTLDHTRKHQYAALGDLDDVLFFANTRSNPIYTGKMLDMFDSLGQALYLTGKRVAGLDIDDNDFREFQEGFAMFDEMVAGDLKSLWTAFSKDWAQGTGDESAVIIDTKGTLPRIPEVPGVIIKEGRMPRIAYVTPITDGDKLKTSWTNIEQAIVNLLETVKEADGPEIPMQEIDESMKDGITYKWTAVPFSTRDARPVIGLTEKRFYASTSQNFIAELNAALNDGEEGQERFGSYSRLNFQALKGLGTAWVDLLAKNADEIFENEFQRDDMMENIPLIKRFLAAMDQMEDLTLHARREGDESRSSLHFKMK